jgi:hypothetical protein
MLCCRQDRVHIAVFEVSNDILEAYGILWIDLPASVQSWNNRMTRSKMSCSKYLCVAPMTERDSVGNVCGSEAYMFLQKIPSVP